MLDQATFSQPDTLDASEGDGRPLAFGLLDAELWFQAVKDVYRFRGWPDWEERAEVDGLRIRHELTIEPPTRGRAEKLWATAMLAQSIIETRNILARRDGLPEWHPFTGADVARIIGQAYRRRSSRQTARMAWLSIEMAERAAARGEGPLAGGGASTWIVGRSRGNGDEHE